MWGNKERSAGISSEERAGVWLLVLGAGTVLVLSGCTGTVIGNGGQPNENAPAVESTRPADAPADTVDPTDAADAFAARLSETLTALAGQAPKPGTDEMRQAFVAAEAEEGLVEVSVDTTPTGLEVDAITGAVAVKDVCVFGQVRDGAVTVTQLPALSGANCFIGDQR